MDEGSRGDEGALDLRLLDGSGPVLLDAGGSMSIGELSAGVVTRSSASTDGDDRDRADDRWLCD